MNYKKLALSKKSKYLSVEKFQVLRVCCWIFMKMLALLSPVIEELEVHASKKKSKKKKKNKRQQDTNMYNLDSDQE